MPHLVPPPCRRAAGRLAAAAMLPERTAFQPQPAGQLRNLEKALGESVRLCDRTALILDIFSQRAQTREGKLQVGS